MSSGNSPTNGFDVDDLCQNFEAEWTPESPLGELIRERLHGFDGNLLSRLVIELVATEHELRTDRGLPAEKSDYLQQLPKFRSEIDTAFEWVNSELSKTKPDRISNPVKLTKLGDYRIVREIGRGGMGVVYEAVQESLDRPVAIKVLSGHPLNLPELKNRFLRETRAIASLHHTNIVDVYGTGEQDGVHYFAMQLVDGQSLDRVIRQRRVDAANSAYIATSSQAIPFHAGTTQSSSEQKAAAELGLQVARALEYAHGKGVLHRDIKPANLLVDKQGAVQVTDFGLAKMLEEEGDLTRTGDVIGTLRFLPPEAMQGEWSETSDVFGLAATIYELLSLSPIYDATGRVQILDQISKAETKRLRAIDPSIPRDLETIVHKGIARDVTDRYQSAGELANDLQRFLNGEPILARRASRAEQLWKWSRRKPALAALMALVTFVAFVGLPTLAILLRNTQAARAIAVEKGTEADDARFVAETKRTEADEARESERLQKIAAQKAQYDAEALRYSSVMQLIGRHADDGVPTEMRPLLNSCIPKTTDGGTQVQVDRRDWEWYFLSQQLDSSQLTLRGHTGPVLDIKLRPDGKQLASVGGSFQPPRLFPGEVILWDAQTGEQQHVLTDFKSGVMGAAYSPDGLRLATISVKETRISDGQAGDIRIWDTHSGKLLDSFPQTGTHPWDWMIGNFLNPILPGIQFSDDGQRLLSWPNPVQVRDVHSGKVFWELEGQEATILPGGTEVAVMRYIRQLDIIDLMTGEKRKTIATPGHMYRMEISRSANKLFAVEKDRAITCDLESFEFQSVPAQAASWCASLPDANQEPIQDAPHYVWGDAAGTIRIQQLGHAGITQLRMGHRSSINKGVISHNGKRLFTASGDSVVKVWDIDVHSTRSLRAGSRDRTLEFAFTDEGQSIAYAASNAPNHDRLAGSVLVTTRARRIEWKQRIPLMHREMTLPTPPMDSFSQRRGRKNLVRSSSMAMR